MHIGGIALLLHGTAKHALEFWSPVSDHLLKARLQHQHGFLTVIVVYAYADVADDTVNVTYYGQLDTVIRTVLPQDDLVVLDDMNSVIGTPQSLFESVISPYRSGTPNDNTICFITWCAANRLSANGLNTFLH